MSRKFFLVIIALLAVGATLVWLFHRLESPPEGFRVTPAEIVRFERKMGIVAPVMNEAPTPLPMKDTVRLAIGSLGFQDDEENRKLGDLVVAQVRKVKGLEMVERQSLDLVLRELDLSLSGLVRAKDAVRAGKILRADWFLLGTAMKANGTNSIVVRLVDAHTGILRDAAVFSSDQSPIKLAAGLAGFVQQCRQLAAEGKPRVYLAIGAFQDLSLNSRQSAFPSQLRAYLTAAYRGDPNVTLLEREAVETLLREAQMDLAGFTETGGTSAPVRMQSAYWLADGYYQSYEHNGYEVEAELDLKRMFGRTERIELRGKPGEKLFKTAKRRMDQIMSQDRAALALSRVSEVRAEMKKGRELERIGDSDYGDFIWTSYEGYNSISENEMARRVRNAEEAARAFETVLLLDPTNREARMCLATCFRKTLIQRMDEARDYYREIIDSPIEDRWSGVARQALLQSFQWSTADSRYHWFEAAAQSTSNPAAAEFYRANAVRAAEDVTIEKGGTPRAEELAEARLFERIKSFDNLVHNKSGSGGFAVGMDDFVQQFGDNHRLAAERLAELFPKMKAQFPDSAPYLLATIVTFQVDTNAPVIAEFERTLDWCAEHPDKVGSRTEDFWRHIRYEPYDWALKHNMPSLAVKILEAIFQAAKVEPMADVGSENEDKMALAYGYLALARWKDALTIFESYTNQPLFMGNSGPWGNAFTVILTSKEAALCRQKLGLPARVDPRAFEFDKTCLHLPVGDLRETHSTFAASSDGLWVAFNNRLMHLDWNLQTNFVAELPIGPVAAPSTMCIGVSNVWLGTAGDGLFELNKASHKIRHLTEEDGLFMNYVSSLHLSGDTLWLGYGNESGGGLGFMGLPTHHFSSFTASLSPESGAELPPGGKVTQIQTDADGDVWFIAGSALWKSLPLRGMWQTEPQNNGVWVRSCSIDKQHLVEGVAVGQMGRLVIWSLRDKQQQLLLEGLPAPPSALALEGGKLWVGGQGFIALVDLRDRKIKKITYISARSVDKIQLGGGYVWAQYGWRLHRARLADLQ